MIKEKRKHLVDFIRQQIIGPGATGYRFIDTQDAEVLKKDLLNESPFGYTDELLNSVPGAFYSSGILFPVDKSDSAQNVTEITENEEDEESTELKSETDIEDPDSLSINQMYPNTMGVSFCLDSKVREDNDLNITISCRYYSKIEKKEMGSRYGLLLEQDRPLFEKFLNEFDLNEPLRASINITEFDDNTVITLNSLSPDDIRETRKRLAKIDRQKASALGSDKPDQPLSGYKEFLFRKIKNSVFEKNDQKDIYENILRIEEIENSVAHIKDLIAIHDSRGYGLWKGKTLTGSLKFPDTIPSEFIGKRIFSSEKYPDLKNIFYFPLSDTVQASLSANIQLSKSSRQPGESLFVKIQLQNTSSPFTRSEGDSRYYSVFNELVNQRMFFGVKIKVESKHITPYRKVSISEGQTRFSEDVVNKFIYRQYQDYAIGHGCSVGWQIGEASPRQVFTEYIPEFDTPDIDPVPKDKNSSNDNCTPKEIFEDTRCMQFKWLSTLSNAADKEVIEGLEVFVNAYAHWIATKRVAPHDPAYRAIIDQELNRCEDDKERMLNNVQKILKGNDNQENLTSFRLMNTAMFMQLWHSVNVKKKNVVEKFSEEGFHGLDHSFYQKSDDHLFGNDPAAWRPFQLAFILLNLDGIFGSLQDDGWPTRNNLVDLVWFPTGGGKTEAYLGLIALTVIHRRKTHGDIGGGTAVFMRYTLRLLTLQQFQRATLLIMALELIRRWNSFELGNEPIYIGLWVGGDSLPNKLSDLEKEYQKLRDGIEPNKVPFRQCPWCGSALRASESPETDAQDVFHFQRLDLSCSNSGCSFNSPTRAKNRRNDHGPIPVSLSDEEIYRHPPALLFGTVDKFAQLAHKISNEAKGRGSDSRRLFGRGNWEAGKPPKGYLTPDLIIQDEMHLLLGPLGSAVALFESAIEQLCSRVENGRTLRPKVISSTATTRNTDLQIMALFDRKVNLFPKPGIECDDSFFSFYKREFSDGDVNKPKYLSRRKYLGFLPTGRTQIWMQMRLAAIFLTHRAIFEKRNLGQRDLLDPGSYSDEFAKAMDYYHSLLSYFNSLREVGKTESQIQTYILKEIRRVFHRVVRPGQLLDPIYTFSIRGGELTGRLSGEEVPRELEKVMSAWSPRKRLAHVNENGDQKPGTTPPDFIVATNMISVGIDVSRFNSIIINSMPRNIAEYIQASSRVARDKEGVVFTVHHPFRARDVSHYEKFIEFHEKMYSYVEPISITPFTKKALDRYLGLYVATMIRHTTQFHNRISASQISDLDENTFNEYISRLTHYFKLREASLSSADVEELVKNLLKPENLKDIDEWIEQTMSEWRAKSVKLSTENKQLVFSYKKNDQEQLYIDVDEYQDNIESDKWQIPQSLRVIEPEAVIKIYQK